MGGGFRAVGCLRRRRPPRPPGEYPLSSRHHHQSGYDYRQYQQPLRDVRLQVCVDSCSCDLGGGLPRKKSVRGADHGAIGRHPFLPWGVFQACWGTDGGGVSGISEGVYLQGMGVHKVVARYRMLAWGADLGATAGTLYCHGACFLCVEGTGKGCVSGAFQRGCICQARHT